MQITVTHGSEVESLQVDDTLMEMLWPGSSDRMIVEDLIEALMTLTLYRLMQDSTQDIAEAGQTVKDNVHRSS